AIVNIGEIDRIAQPNNVITKNYLLEHGTIKRLLKGQTVKILAVGKITKPIVIKKLLVSASAQKKIIAAGGSVINEKFKNQNAK
ncbi:MAG: uL15 family ribosomal protein, partial [Parcubacteria group bacterium]|nr:uL15 family ribosomal protein [Parcubacteria group bacterium]